MDNSRKLAELTNEQLLQFAQDNQNIDLNRTAIVYYKEYISRLQQEITNKETKIIKLNNLCVELQEQNEKYDKYLRAISDMISSLQLNDYNYNAVVESK